MNFANLHIHTYFSDGHISPSQLIRELYLEKSLTCFALTDHDSLSGIEPVFRLLKKHQRENPSHTKCFLPGVELSLQEEQSRALVHLVGLFPNVTPSNYRDTLPPIEEILGGYCRIQCLKRGKFDMEERIEKAFASNLEGICDRFSSAGEVIRLLKKTAEEKNDQRRKEARKEGDVIQHPIPITYQIIIEYWETLFPGSSREKAPYYLLRPDPAKVDRLARLYLAEGMHWREALSQAEKNLSVLATWDKDKPAPYSGFLEGLELLKRAGAVTILAHPAAEHARIPLDTFDRYVTYPLIKAGLEGIELFYPYEPSHQKEFEQRYGKIAVKHGLLISGGTDYHGDGRIGLANVKLPLKHAKKIIAAGSAKQ